ncbi:DUF488 domain-containing protein [Microbacterium sp. MC2]
MEISVKRVYEEPASTDGFRVLVDRLWPRGLTKDRAAVDLWDKDVAPSAELRKAFHHEGMSWPDFEKAYRAELADGSAVAALREQLTGHDTVTLLYATHDETHNHARLLREALGGQV